MAANGALMVVAQNLPLNTPYPRFGGTVGADQDPGGELTPIILGQTFLAQESGQLYTIEAAADMGAGYIPVNPLMVSVVSIVDGQSGSILASALVSPSEIPLEYSGSGFSIIAQFADGLFLEAGTQYGIEFSSPTGPAHYMLYGASTVTDYYPDGVAYLRQTSDDSIDRDHQGDFYFRVTAHAPEPSVMLLNAFAALILLRRRR